MTFRDQLQASLGSAYTLERELGGGGMSRVFVAVETRLGRRVVVKVLAPEIAAGVSAERFEREIRVAANLQQANIVPVLSAGETDGAPYYSMPYIAGESLRARLNEQGPFSVGETVNILRDVARALAYAHALGIVHRDIKPDNVLLSGGTAMVTDFGIAKAISAARAGGDADTLTQLGTAIGTPAYISPEQAAGDPAIDHRADLYSFGCMAYEMLAGQPPFANRPPQRMMAAHLTEAPRPLGELRPDVPPALGALVMRCLEKDAAARPQSAGEIVAALDGMPTSDPGRPAMPAVLLGGPRAFWKALAAYAVACAMVAVVARAAMVVIGLPAWVFPGAMIVMALGAPVIAFTAYTQRVVRRTITRAASAGSPHVTHGTMATLAVKASPYVSWRRTALGGMWAIGAFAAVVGAFMLLRALGIGPAGSLLAAGKFSARAPVLIADFTTSNTDSSLGPVVSDAVRAGLAESKLIALVPPAEVAATLGRMQRPATTRLDMDLAREVAEREGVRAIVDGSVTGVPGGYILTLQLVTADSGAELASFRETGNGPKGLIDASDKLARALRTKIGESLRAVQSTPPLERVTTSSLQALRYFSQGQRFTNQTGELDRAYSAFRQAVAIDSTFALGWADVGISALNVGAAQATIDSALEHAYRLRDRLSDLERARLLSQYYDVGPHRDRPRALDAYAQRSLQEDSDAAFLDMSLVLRDMRQYARAESLNVRELRIDSGQTITYLDLIAIDLDRWPAESAQAAFEEGLRKHPGSPVLLAEGPLIAYARGDLDATRRAIDSLAGLSDTYARQAAFAYGSGLALIEGQLARAEHQFTLANPDRGYQLLASLWLVTASTWYRESNAGAAERIDSALARYPLRTIALEDRPYLAVATAWARIGRPDRAEAVMAAYRTEVTDTALLRLEAADLHSALGEIALAEHHPGRAIEEFRRGDIAYDGMPVSECAPCLPLELARAYDAAGQADSAIAAYEQFIATRFANRLLLTDGLGLALAHERLGELYEARGDRSRALAHDQRFVELWKNADADLQPRVAQVKRRMARLGEREGAGP